MRVTVVLGANVILSSTSDEKLEASCGRDF